MNKAVVLRVRQRARGRCEYCGFDESFVRFKFQIEHIIARKHGGTDAIDNLALACGFCNLHKGPNLSGIDPHTQEIVELFHPRRQVWSDHFIWDAAFVRGLSKHGRASVEVLAMNHELQISRRKTLIDGGLLLPPG